MLQSKQMEWKRTGSTNRIKRAQNQHMRNIGNKKKGTIDYPDYTFIYNGIEKHSPTTEGGLAIKTHIR